MKLFVAIALFFSVITASASHISGGDIQYEYIGDSTGISHHYRIFLRLYRRVGGAGLPTTTTVTVNSSCFSLQSVSMPLIVGSGQIDSTLFDCVDVPTLVLEQYIYIGYVILSGACSDYTFSWNSCCRPPGITNLVNSQSAFYFEATLNNSLGNNSSPFFVSSPTAAFCTNQSFNYAQAAIESDGDSIHYSIIACRGNNATNDLPLNAGWSHQQPITTNPPGSLTIDSQTGIISFTPSSIEIDVLGILVDEYRWDTIYNVWAHIGSSSRDMMVQIVATCSQVAQQGVTLNYNSSSIYTDSISGLPVKDFVCNTSVITLHFKNKLDCKSIAADGTDFAIVTPQLQLLPILSTTTICDYNNETKKIHLNLVYPISLNGDHYIISKIGSDGNTLFNKCGFPLSLTDTIIARVSGCSGIGIVENDFSPSIIYPNPVHAILTVESSQFLNEISVLSLTGERLINYKINEESTTHSIDMSSFAQGVYIIEISTPQGVERKKVIRQ